MMTIETILSVSNTSGPIVGRTKGPRPELHTDYWYYYANAFPYNLQIKGREEVLRIVPEFDFYKLRRIIRLQWDSHCNPENGTADADLILTIAYDAQSASTPQFTFRFGGVARAKLPELLP